MLSQEERNQLLQKLNEKKNIIKELRSKLNEINNQKEHWFDLKGKYSNEIRGIISQVKDAKSSRDSLTSTVKDNKKTRDELNQKIKENIDELEKLENEKKEIIQKYGVRGDPALLKREVERLDFKLETTVMSFDKEQKLMKQIKELKQKYKEAEKVSTVWKKILELTREIETMKQDANLFHRKIQVQAKQSQERHESLIESSKLIKDLRKKEKEAYTKFMGFKGQFKEVNDNLKEELKELNVLYGKLEMNKEELIKVRKERQQKTLEERKKEVDEKLKKGMKLTTEDILAFQSEDEGK